MTADTRYLRRPGSARTEDVKHGLPETSDDTGDVCRCLSRVGPTRELAWTQRYFQAECLHSNTPMPVGALAGHSPDAVLRNTVRLRLSFEWGSSHHGGFEGVLESV